MIVQNQKQSTYNAAFHSYSKTKTKQCTDYDYDRIAIKTRFKIKIDFKARLCSEYEEACGHTGASRNELMQ